MASYVLVIHTCRDFSEWKKGYAGDLPQRVAAGLTELNLLQDSAEPNRVTILFKSANDAKAKAFAESPTLKTKMAECGVIGKPEMYFLHDAK